MYGVLKTERVFALGCRVYSCYIYTPTLKFHPLTSPPKKIILKSHNLIPPQNSAKSPTFPSQKSYRHSYRFRPIKSVKILTINLLITIQTIKTTNP